MRVSLRRGAGGLLALAATAAVLHGLRHQLATPPLTSWDGATAWYERTGPIVATMAGLRVTGLAVSIWLAAAVALQLVAALVDDRGVRLLADVVSPRWLRRMGHGMARASLSAGLTVGLAAPPLAAMPIGVAQTQPADEANGESVAVMRPLPPTAAPTAASDEVPTTQQVPTTLPPPTAASPHPEIVVVTAGSSCWSLAAEALEDRLGRAGSDAEIRRLWSRMIAANADRFVTGDPDLIYPGQELQLPAD